jgi:hypothetical protein
MTVATQPGYDVTGKFLAHVPNDGHIRALYITEANPGDGIAATPAQLVANPGCLRIGQSPVLAADEAGHPDYIDYETNAATIADLVPWHKEELAAWRAGARPGQRQPAVYASRGSMAMVIDELRAGGVSACPLIIADWGDNQPSTLAARAAAAAREVAASTGSYPVVGRQYSDQGGGGLYDLDVFSVPWVAGVSRPAPRPVLVSVIVTGGFSDGTTRRVIWP